MGAGHHGDRPDGLPVAALQQPGVRAGRREALGIEAPPRATYIRVLLVELQRMASHLAWLGTTGLDMGAQSVFFYAFDMREGILDIFEEATGARMNPSYIRVGGLAKTFRSTSTRSSRRTRQVSQAPGRSASDLERKPDLSGPHPPHRRISAEKAIAYGLTGPNLRACGVEYDVRKAFPYLSYDEFDFDVPVGHERRRVRPVPRADAGAARSRTRFAVQALERLPEGDVADPGPEAGPAAQARSAGEHGVAHPPLQAGLLRLRRARGRGLRLAWKARGARSATTSYPTARTSRGGCGRGRPPSTTPLRSRR